MHFGPFRRAFFGSLVGIFGLFAAGCGQSTPQTSTPESPKTAGEVLERMVAAYRSAKGYEDAGTVRVHYQRGETPSDETAPFSVAMLRPNKLRLHAYQAMIVSDGATIRSAIQELPGQVFTAAAPKIMNQQSLAIDTVLTDALEGGIAGSPLQLFLLGIDQPPGDILTGAQLPTLLEPEKIDDRLCHRVQVMSVEGTFLYWIDQESFILRRMAFPTAELAQMLSADGPVSGVSLTADFTAARFTDSFPAEAFQFSVPQGTKMVPHFVNRPNPPSQLLGQQLPDFTLATLDGTPITREQLQGKIVILEFLQGWCFSKASKEDTQLVLDECRALESVRQKYRDAKDVVVMAVSYDSKEVSDEQVRTDFALGKMTLPVARVPEAAAREVFPVPAPPTMFVLGSDGTVQDYKVGFQPPAAKDLAAKVERLRAGENLAQQAVDDYRKHLRQFEELSGVPGETSQTRETEVPKAPVAATSQPTRLKLNRLWTNTDLKQPGNILVLPVAEGHARLLVVDGWRTVTELSEEGKVSGSRPLSIPEGQAVGYLRTATDADGRRWFVATAGNQPQLHLFDDQWKLLSNYPIDEKVQITDVQLGDLDGDGKVDLNVAFWGQIGVQSLTVPALERRWWNRNLNNVFSLAMSSPDEKGKRLLLAAANNGMLIPIDDQGQNGQNMPVGEQFVKQVIASDLDGDGLPEFCALAVDKIGEEFVIGLGPRAEEKWSYPLPHGVQPNGALEALTSGQLVGKTGQWIAAGADGSIHFLAADGKPVDQFNYGAALSGLAAARFGDRNMLLVSSAKGVEAWQVESP